jgi:hypothetical protein
MRSIIDELYEADTMVAAFERLDDADPIAAKLAREVYDRLHERLRLTDEEHEALTRWVAWSRGALDADEARNTLAKAAARLGLPTPIGY